jgi:polyferredoxin
VFGVLAKIAPFEFKVDQPAWEISQKSKEKPGTVNCAPMLPLRTMVGASGCHMCGRCSGFRSAIKLSFRSPSREIVEVAGLEARPHESVLVLFALAGLVTACFQWSSSLVFSSIRAGLADLGARHNFLDLLGMPLPWWMLTNYSERNDVMLPLDAVAFLLFVIVFASLMATSLTLLLMFANICLGEWKSKGFHHLVQTLIPVVGCGLFTGLLSLPAGQLRMDGTELPWLVEIKWAALPISVFWCARLGYQVARRHHSSRRASATCAALVFLSATLVAAGSLGILV